MRRSAASVLLILMLIFNATPVLALGIFEKPQPEKPYDKVVAKNGSWYSDRVTFDTSSELVVAFDGAYETDNSLLSQNPPEMKFTIGEKIVLKGIYLPYVKKQAKPVVITLKDDIGNVYGPFKTEEAVANTIVETSIFSPVAAKSSEVESVNYVFKPEYEIALPAGKYTLISSEPQGQVRNKASGAGGAFLIKGVNFSANERYKQAMQEWEVVNIPGTKPGEDDKKLGNEEFAGKDLDKYQYEAAEKPPTKKPAVFTLEAESLIGEVIVNTFNDGKGSPPGILSIQDEKGAEVAAFQSVGGTLGKVANGVWAIVPNLVLPAGNYKVVASNPDVVSYDKFGNPLFFVTIAPPPVTRYDFTGTYNINLEARKTSTLMGPVTSKDPSFSLEDFQLTILDKDGTIEFIGEYEGMPFSQGCEIIEETQNKVVATFNFSADLSKLPYQAKIGAQATLTLTKSKNGKAQIDITGTGTYMRGATAEKGGDFNTYALKAVGAMKTKDLQPFVVTALGQAGGAGNIPGPGSPWQAATGLLFPPLVGLVASIAQELLKPKPAKPAKPKKYTPEWYAEKYPGKTREQLGWIMLADAMANTDEPDEGDAESVGDNEKPGGEDYVAPESSEQEGSEEDGSIAGDTEESTEETSGESEEGLPADSDSVSVGSESEKENSQNPDEQKPDDKQETETAKQDQQTPPAEPETLTLQTDHTGRTTTYVKDATTGEWVNPDTGGVLDMDRYKRDVAPNFEKDKAFIDQQRDKLEKGDTPFDRDLKAAAQARKDATDKAAYMDKLADKYGTSDKGELEKIIADNQQKQMESSASWNKAADRYGYAETGAKVVGVVADTAIDGLASVTGPAGKSIRAVYKVTKSIAGTMADDGVSVTSFTSGAVKGGADAFTDYMDNPYGKAVVTVGGEVVGGAISKGAKGAADGLVDGVSKVITGSITDKIGGNGYGNEMSTMALNNGNVRVAIKSGEKWIGKTLTEASANTFSNKKIMCQVGQSVAKGTSGLLDEFGIKPFITEPIKDSYK